MAIRIRRGRAAAWGVLLALTACFSTSRLTPSSTSTQGPAVAVILASSSERHHESGGHDVIADEHSIPFFGKKNPVHPVKASRDVSMHYVNPTPETRHGREWTQHVLRRIGRWQERWIGPANFDRQGLRISAQDSYALVAVVLVQVVIGLYGVVEVVKDEDDPSILNKRLWEVQMYLLMAACLTSTFTMVMFLLSKVYCVTALAFWKDVSYNTFHTATMMYRNQAFWSMMVSTACFLLCFCLNLQQRMKGPRGYLLTLLAIAIELFFLYQFSIVVDAAESYVFDSYPDTYRSLA